MRRQMQLAREYGIGAFCSYFYWFAGKTLLETPLQQWLADRTLDLPLCLCWANENWSRRWDGRADDILIGQQHSPADDLAFIDIIARYLADPRYLRVDGKPLLLVYRPGLLPDPKATAARWREWCRANGIGEIQLAYVQSFDRVDPRAIGFDAAVEFPPNNTTPDRSPHGNTCSTRIFMATFTTGVSWHANRWRHPTPRIRATQASIRAGTTSHGAAAPAVCSRMHRRAAIATGCGTPIGTAQRRFPAQPLVFVNAWNEWAEGAVLEPDTRLGHAWLEATRAALAAGDRPPIRRPCAVIHVWYPELLDELVAALRASGIDWRIVITTAAEREQSVREQMAQSRPRRRDRSVREPRPRHPAVSARRQPVAR